MSVVLPQVYSRLSLKVVLKTSVLSLQKSSKYTNLISLPKSLSIVERVTKTLVCVISLKILKNGLYLSSL